MNPTYKKLIVNDIKFDGNTLILNYDSNQKSFQLNKDNFSNVNWSKIKYPLQLYDDNLILTRLSYILPKCKAEKVYLERSTQFNKRGTKIVDFKNGKKVILNKPKHEKQPSGYLTKISRWLLKNMTNQE